MFFLYVCICLYSTLFYFYLPILVLITSCSILLFNFHFLFRSFFVWFGLFFTLLFFFLFAFVPDDNVLLYLLSKNSKSAPNNKYFHYTSKKSLDKLGGGNLVKRNLVNPVDFDTLDVTLFNNELPCIFEYYVNGNNEVVMACKHEKSSMD